MKRPRSTLKRRLPALGLLILGLFIGGISGALIRGTFLASRPSSQRVAEAPVPTVTVTETITVEPSPTATPDVDVYPYKGYPKVVPKQSVPDFMHDEIQGDVTIAVAPGVWTQKVPGVTLMESVRDGTFFGYCAAVKKAAKQLNNNSGSSCW